MADDNLIAARGTEDNYLQQIAELQQRVLQLENNQAALADYLTTAAAAATYVAIPASPANYTITGGSTDRSLTPASDTLPNVANVVKTVIEDLIALGIFQ